MSYETFYETFSSQFSYFGKIPKSVPKCLFPTFNQSHYKTPNSKYSKKLFIAIFIHPIYVFIYLDIYIVDNEKL